MRISDWSSDVCSSDLSEMSYDVLDLGTNGTDLVDYPDFAQSVADALADGRVRRAVLICGTGIGMTIAANRHRHVRAALCHDVTEARLYRRHTDANVLPPGARPLGPARARQCPGAFLDRT